MACLKNRGSFFPIGEGIGIGMLIAFYAVCCLHPILGALLLLGWTWGAGALVVVWMPWPLLPLRARRWGEKKAGPVRTAAAMMLMLAPVLLIMQEYPWAFVFRGQFLSVPFNRAWAGLTLDQPTMGKWLYWFVFVSAIILPFVAAVRELSDRSTRSGYWVFAILTILLCFCLMSLLAPGTIMLIKYVGAMGFTAQRIAGLGFGLAGYTGIAGFLWWVLRATNGHDGQHGQDGRDGQD